MCGMLRNEKIGRRVNILQIYRTMPSFCRKPYLHHRIQAKTTKPSPMNFGTYDEQQAMKRYIIALLVKQALSDDDFSNFEKKYLAFAARSLRLNDSETAAVRQNPDAFEISPPPDESKRMTIFYYLLFMMRADRKITQEEEQLCYQVGFRLGFRQAMITNLIKLMKDYLGEELPPNAMLERIKPFLN